MTSCVLVCTLVCGLVVESSQYLLIMRQWANGTVAFFHYSTRIIINSWCCVCVCPEYSGPCICLYWEQLKLTWIGCWYRSMALYFQICVLFCHNLALLWIPFLSQIDGQQLRYKTFEEVLELLKQTNPDEDGKKKIIKQTMPPVLASIASDIDLDASKIDSLLSHSPPKYVYT